VAAEIEEAETATAPVIWKKPVAKKALTSGKKEGGRVAPR